MTHRRLGVQIAAITMAAVGVVLVGSGCQSGSEGPSAAEKQAFEKRAGVDETAARAFLRDVEAKPAAERTAYVQQHPKDLRNMALIPDPDLQTKFRKLMLNR
jgi:hypothetical protein